MSIGQELLNVPMGDMIRQMAFAIAEGQQKLDASSIEVAEMMGGLKPVYGDDGKMAFEDSRVFFGYDVMTAAEATTYIAAQEAIDKGSTQALTDVLNAQTGTGVGSNDLVRIPTRLSMLELGFTPTFYQFVDTIIEVKIAIKITRTTERTRTTKDTTKKKSGWGVGGGLLGSIFGGSRASSSQVATSQVDASYSSKYSYSAEGSSLLRTKLVPLPPPPILEERIREQMEEETARRKALLDRQLNPPTKPN